MKRKIAEKIIKRIKNDEEMNVSHNSVIRARDLLGSKYIYDRYKLKIRFMCIYNRYDGSLKKTDQLYIQDDEVVACHGEDVEHLMLEALNVEIQEINNDPKRREMFKIIADKMFVSRDTK